MLSQEANKMHIFLNFAFDVELLKTHLRDLWMQSYDYQYIDNYIIGGIEKHQPAV